MPCFGKVHAKICAYFSFSKTFLIHNFWKGIYSYHVQFETKQFFDNKSVAIGIDVGKNTQEEEEMIKEVVLLQA